MADNEQEKNYTETEYKNVTLVESKHAKVQAEIKELEFQLKGFKSQYFTDESRIKELEQSAITAAEAYQHALDEIHKSLECCGNCGFYIQSTGVCGDIKSILSVSITMGIKHCPNWKQKPDV